MSPSCSTLLIINDDSRSGDDDIDRATERLQHAGPVDVARPENPGALPEAIRQRGDQFDRITLAGGDGTINLALDALLEIDVPVGLLQADGPVQSLLDPETSSRILNPRYRCA